MLALTAKLRTHARRNGYALADQVIVGGMNFLTMILVGRIAGAHQLGLFALGFTIVLLVVALQESIITTPATIFGPRMSGHQRRRYFGVSLLLQAILSLIVGTTLFSAAGVVSFSLGDAEMTAGLAVLALVIPFWCLREFCRRLAFAQLNARSVLALDVTVAVVLATGLTALIATGRLTAATAFAATGVATCGGTLVWLARHRREFRIARSELLPALKRNWITGKWILMGQTTSIATGESLPWIIAGMLGTEATGAFAACRAIFRVINPVVVTVSNLLTPYAAHAYADGGQQQVDRVVRKAVLGLGALMAAFFLFLTAFGGHVLGILFGNAYADYRLVLTILAAGQFALLIRMGPARGLLVVDRPQLGVVAELLGSLIVLGAAVPLIVWWGLYGAAGSFLIGTSLATLLVFVFYRQVSIVRRAECRLGGEALARQKRARETAANELPAPRETGLPTACLEAVE